MSLLIYGGSSQFVISGLLLSGASLSSMVLATFLVNFRHLLMSLSVSFHFKEATLAHRVGIGSLLTDESYGVLMTAIQNKEAINTSMGTWIKYYGVYYVGGFNSDRCFVRIGHSQS